MGERRGHQHVGDRLTPRPVCAPAQTFFDGHGSWGGSEFTAAGLRGQHRAPRRSESRSVPTERQTVATQAGLASDKKLGYDGGESSIGKSAESPGPVMSSGSSRTALISSAIGRLSHGVGRWSRHGLNLLFPPRCAYCDAELCHPGDDDLLRGDRCRGALGPDDWAYCLRCGAQASPGEPAPESCDMCRSARLKFDTVVSMGAYRSELGRAVLRMKQPAGDLLSAAIGRLYRLRRGADLAALS